MTVYGLQESLGEAIKTITAGMLLKDESGGLVQINTFPQCLPKQKQEIAGEDQMLLQEDGQEPYPYCVIKADSGDIETLQGAQVIKVVLVFGIYDDDLKCQGHRTVVNIIHKISEYFTKDPVLDGRYMMDLKEGISWVLDDEDDYPYYFGAMTMSWNTFFVRMEEEEYA